MHLTGFRPTENCFTFSSHCDAKINQYRLHKENYSKMIVYIKLYMKSNYNHKKEVPCFTIKSSAEYIRHLNSQLNIIHQNRPTHSHGAVNKSPWASSKQWQQAEGLKWVLDFGWNNCISNFNLRSVTVTLCSTSHMSRKLHWSHF